MGFPPGKIVLFAVGLLASGSAHADPATVLLIRHAEKQPNGRQLSEEGWERAKSLPRFFQRQESDFGQIDALYAMGNEDGDSSLRAGETLKFVARKLKLPITESFKSGDERDLAKAILKDKSLDGKTVLIAWNHEGAHSLAKHLGVHHAPDWSGDRFDEVWKITFPKHGDPELQVVPQRLMPGDLTRLPSGCEGSFSGLKGR